MQIWPKGAGENNVCARFSGPDGAALRARLDNGGLALLDHAQGEDFAALSKKWAPARGVVLLGPEAHSFGLVDAPKLGAQVERSKIDDALRWAYAKDSDIDMAQAEWETLRVPGMDQGGSLIKESYWVFAVDRARLAQALSGSKSGIRVEAVDAIATAQRNLCWAEVKARPDRAGGYASVVIGAAYSSIGIVSLDGDLLFHKQMEWTSAGMRSADTREKIVVDLQRNLGYFERRLSSFAVVRGHVFCVGAPEVAATFNEKIGTFEWSPGMYPGVSWGGGLTAEEMDGDSALLLGSLWRWA